MLAPHLNMNILIRFVMLFYFQMKSHNEGIVRKRLKQGLSECCDAKCVPHSCTKSLFKVQYSPFCLTLVVEV